jgi:hypothetical protein
MGTTTRILVPAARASETVLRRAFTLTSGRRTVRLVTVRIISPALTAIEHFLDARAKAFSTRGWV